MPVLRMVALASANAKLGLMHQIGALNGHRLLKLGKNGLADAKRLDGFLISAGEQVFVVRRGQAKDFAK